ncbi:twin-arginine translocation signal domain-containing protein, partial [Bacteroides thetaiotaomicron]|nr:twin-arginine translocation signal domain-containing protein [Bacteroides thetaiotaomicron]
MNRRDFLTLTGAAAAAGVSMWQAPAMAASATQAGRPAAGYANVLILVELKGGNDGLNTVVPYADPLY